MELDFNENDVIEEVIDVEEVVNDENSAEDIVDNEETAEDITDNEETTDNEITEEDTTSKKKSKRLKTFLCVFIPLIIAVILGITAYVVFKKVQHEHSIMPKSHIYVCDNPKVFSDFDKWIREDLKITWTPTYMIVKDGYVVGAFAGAIPADKFTENLAYSVAYDIKFQQLPDLEISNLEGERKPISEILGQPGTNILEIVWVDCGDCTYQDQHYTDDVYEMYTTDRIYRYYIKSDKAKVEQSVDDYLERGEWTTGKSEQEIYGSKKKDLPDSSSTVDSEKDSSSN